MHFPVNRSRTGNHATPTSLIPQGGRIILGKSDSRAIKAPRLSSGSLIAIIFEVTPNDGIADDHIKIAGEMRGFVKQIDGFISVERFQSLTNPDELLSISFF